MRRGFRENQASHKFRRCEDNNVLLDSSQEFRMAHAVKPGPGCGPATDRLPKQRES